MEVFDNELHDYLEQKENECSECGTLIDDDKTYCSEACFKSSLL